MVSYIYPRSHLERSSQMIGLRSYARQELRGCRQFKRVRGVAESLGFRDTV